MAKFFIGLVTGVAIVFLTLILLFFAALRFREKPPAIAANSALVLRLNGEIPEKAALELPDFLSGDKGSVTVPSIWQNLKKAASDSNITALVVEPEGVSAGWAKLEEIRSDIEEFRKSGKPVFAYLHTPSAREYYLALAADRIYMGPSDPLMLKGMRAEVMYFKKTLDKIGVNVEVEHAGKYKDFGDMFSRSDMSPETREVLSSVLDGLYGNLVTRIAAARKKSPEETRTVIDNGPFTATDALKAGLVDELRYEDQLWGELKDRLKSEPAKVSFEKYAKTAATTGKSTIALVIGDGEIVRGNPGDNGSDERSLTSYGFNKLLKRVGNDSTVKGVIVRIDSPGGEVTASDDLWREMNLLSKKKPVVISMSDVAASGGYYMAMTGDPIVAYPETETGSIGVVFGKPNLHGLYDKLGVSKDAVQRGKHADIDSDYTPLTPEERAKLKDGIDESYREFVTKVATARKRPFSEIEPVAQGRVWLGSQAKDHGLVDELGGLDTAVAMVKKKAGIGAGETVTIVTYPERRTLLEMLMRKSTPEEMLETRVRQVVGRMPVRSWMRGGLLSIVPMRIEVR
jgi:protease IV